MQKLLAICAVLLTLSGCVTKMDIEQGNVLNDEMVRRIHTGMSEGQVKDILGEPVLVNTFNDNRLDYVYTFKPGYGATTEKYLTLIFRNHRLDSIQGNMYSTFMK